MASQKYRPKILEIYASSEEEAQKIRESARQSGQTISKFVMNVLRPALYHTDEGTLKIVDAFQPGDARCLKNVLALVRAVTGPTTESDELACLRRLQAACEEMER